MPLHMPLHQRRLSLAVLLMVLLIAPTLFAQTDPLPLPTGQSENGRVGSSPTPLSENLAPLTLLSPVDGATIVDLLPTFSWTAHPNATDYKFILKRGNKTKLKLTFKAVDVCIDGICTANLSTLASLKPLKSDRTYTWSIKASQARQKLTPSPRQTFMVYGSSVEMNFLPTVTPYGYFLPYSSPIPDEMSRQTLPIVSVNAASVSAINTAITSTLNTNGTCKNQQTVINLTKTSDYFITAPYTTVAPTYGKTGIREIKCVVTIEGNNRKLARSSSATESFRILTVIPGGNLTIRNLTIENGVATERGGGGILAHGSESGVLARLSVYNSVIRNNTIVVGTPLQWLGGGIYVYKGALRIEGSSITGNTNGVTNGDGGGIGVIRSSPLIQWNDIRNNNTRDDGNAIYIDGSSTINSNCLVGNHNTTTGNGSISVYAITTGNGWTNNWWGSSAGPFINGTPSSATRDSAYAVAGGSFTYQPYWSAQPSNCRAAPTHTPTPNITATPTLIPDCNTTTNDVRRAGGNLYLQPSLDQDGILIGSINEDLPGQASFINNKSWLWSPNSVPTSVTVNSINIIGRVGEIPWTDTSSDWLQADINASPFSFKAYLRKPFFSFNCVSSTLDILPPPAPETLPVAGLNVFSDVSPIVGVFDSFQPPATMGGCELHVGTNCADRTGSTLDVVPRNIELCIDTAVNRSACNTIRIPVLSPVNACGILVNSTTSGISIVLNIDLLSRSSDCRGARQDGDRQVILTHTIPSTTPLVSGGILNVGSSYVRVMNGEVVGNLCTETEAVSVCKVTSGAANHLAFQLNTINFNKPSGNDQQPADVLGFLAKPRCLYDDWKAIPGNPTRQPLADRFHACPN